MWQTRPRLHLGIISCLPWCVSSARCPGPQAVIAGGSHTPHAHTQYAGQRTGSGRQRMLLQREKGTTGHFSFRPERVHCPHCPGSGWAQHRETADMQEPAGRANSPPEDLIIGHLQLVPHPGAASFLRSKCVSTDRSSNSCYGLTCDPQSPAPQNVILLEIRSSQMQFLWVKLWSLGLGILDVWAHRGWLASSTVVIGDHWVT